MSALPRTLYGVQFVTAYAAAHVAFGLSALNSGNGRILCDSMNRQKRLPNPNSPNDPTAIGMKTLFVSSISPMTSSADKALFVIGLVPPVHLANFIFSPSLKRKSVSLY
jgi:hypothetical protein